MTPLGWLNRMTQFKEKSGKHKDKSCLGLYSYPVLMAADILLYQATHVPVGEDQKQHLELTRDIATSFNHNYNCEHFTLPEPMILGEAARVMSLRDGRNKMSKSDISEYSRINLTDSADDIVQKVKKAKSDAITGMSYDVENRPEASNLISIYAALTDQKVEKVATEFAGMGFSDFKTALTDVLVETTVPIGKKIQEYLGDTTYLDSLLQEGSQQARAIASANLKEIKRIMGFLDI
jgi:tryptophanyl-tRNA synthetase